MEHCLNTKLDDHLLGIFFKNNFIKTNGTKKKYLPSTAAQHMSFNLSGSKMPSKWIHGKLFQVHFPFSFFLPETHDKLVFVFDFILYGL